jgi:adenosylcobinamide-GDP ribazoletransferase
VGLSPIASLRGAVGFLTRVPVGTDAAAWEAFRMAPWSLPAVGYLVGALVALPVWLDLPGPTLGVAYLVAIVAVTGVTHADGLADIGDAAVVHGEPAERRAVAADTTLGVGGTVALVVVAAGLFGGAFALASLPVAVGVALVVASEVGAKLGMAALAGLGRSTHEGLGSQVLDPNGPRSLGPAVLVALPAVVLTWPGPAATVATAGGLAGALLVGTWARRRLHGLSGDALGAANEVGRVVALHLGVLAWTLS